MSDRPAWPGSAGMLLRQVRHQLTMFWRVPVAVFFTVALPIVILVVFNAVFGGGTISDPAGEWPISQFYVGALAAFTAVSATYTNLANMVPIRREEGVLKRWRATPLPVGILVAGHVLAAVVIALVGAVTVLVLGVVAYDVSVDVSALPAAIVTFLVAVASFAALGMAVAALVPSASSASAVANATILPLAFVSNVFIPLDDAPGWIGVIGDVFPLKPFVEAFQASFHPAAPATSPEWSSLGVIALWGAIGAAVALGRFRWDAAPGGSTRRRRAARAAAVVDDD
ncbi:MAG: ABC transporter permease [Ilumatobacteraceae bacterium]|jgi:ABC-2 type transport system permease protein